MAAGLILGPSVFGRLAPSLSAAVFPAPSLGFVNAIAQVGLLLFMFLVGLELDPAHLRRRGKAALLTSHASIVAPLLLGTALALWLYPRLAPAGVGFTPFALFVGAAMSVTAFPVLARILADRGMTTTPLGALAIVCAAVGDVTAWCILAAVVVIARASGVASLAFTLAGTAIYLALMFTLVRPLLARVAERAARPGSSAQTQLALVMLLALSSAWVTEKLGIHALFGAFLVGALLPPSGPLAEALSSRLRDLMIVLLLPLFFAFTGLRTTVSLISGGWLWLVCGLVLLVAIAGKLGGSAVAARAAGMGWRDALVTRHADEHARADGARDPQRRARHRRAVADAVRDDGRDGARDDGTHHAPARSAAARTRPRSDAGDLRRGVASSRYEDFKGPATL